MVSGPFRQQERSPQHIILVRRQDYGRPRRGNAARVEMTRLARGEDPLPYQLGQLDLILGQHYAARPRGSGPSGPPDEQMGPGAGIDYLAFDHRDRVVVTRVIHPCRGSSHYSAREILR